MPEKENYKSNSQNSIPEPHINLVCHLRKISMSHSHCLMVVFLYYSRSLESSFQGTNLQLFVSSLPDQTNTQNHKSTFYLHANYYAYKVGYQQINLSVLGIITPRYCTSSQKRRESEDCSLDFSLVKPYLMF